MGKERLCENEFGVSVEKCSVPKRDSFILHLYKSVTMSTVYDNVLFSSLFVYKNDKTAIILSSSTRLMYD